MKLVSKIAPEPALWFENLDIKELRSAMYEFRDNLLFAAVEEDFRKLAFAEIRKIDNQNVRTFLEALVSTTPVSDYRRFSEADFKIGEIAGRFNTFDAMAEDATLIELLRVRQPVLKHGESRELGYARTLKLLAARARVIEAVDAYFPSSVLGGDGRGWLLDQLLQHSNCDLIVHTRLKEGVFEMTDVPRLESELIGRISAAAESFGTLRVKIWTSLKHNRRMNFRFKKGEVTVNLESGFDTFARDKFSENFELEVKAGELNFTSLVSRINSGKLVKEIEFRRNTIT